MGVFKKIVSQIGLTEIIFCLGLFFIAFASCRINYILGLYVIGGMFIFLSFILARADRK